MPVAGARALLSAKKRCPSSSTCRLRRGVAVAVSSSSSAVSGTAPFAVRSYQHSISPRHAAAAAGTRRTFHTSSSLARPDDTSSNQHTEEKKPETTAPENNTEQPPASGAIEEKTNNSTAASENQTQPTPESSPPQQPNDAAAATSASTSASAAAAKREKLKSQGYGSARARANRTRIDEVPPLNLPPWFNEKYVKLHEDRLNAHPPFLSPDDKDALLSHLDKLLDKVAFSEEEIAAIKRDWWLLKQFPVAFSSTDVETGKETTWADWQCTKINERLQVILSNLHLQVLAAAFHPDASPWHLDGLKESHNRATVSAGISRPLWWSSDEISGEARKWLSYVKPEWGPQSGELLASPLVKRPDSEYTHCVELLSAVRTALKAPLPEPAMRGDARRPVTLLPVLNCKAPGVAMKLVDDVAADLEADVVHLDAFILARVVGKYMKQNLYWSRGPISMLGYAAAEMNGRIASRTDADGEGGTEIGMVAVSLPPRFRNFFKSGGLGGGDGSATDGGRWEELKLTSALECLINAVEVEAAGRGQFRGRDLIVHIHDYVELNSLQPSLISKIRLLVDRMWGQGGRKVVIVGSSAGDMQKSTQWRDQLLEIAREGNHVIPFHFGENAARWEETDNIASNLENIQDMLEATLGSSKVEVSFADWEDEKYRRVVDAFRSHLYDIQWVYRFVSAMVGGRDPVPEKFTMEHMLYAMDVVADSNARWNITYSTSAPYHSPLHIPRSSLSSMSGFFSQQGQDWGSPSQPSANLPNGTTAKDLDTHEKKLLSGLINAEDIHTTFNDIIVPKETKESLIGLTSLSLTRPDAFTYGVLKTERIPGCLLYGPPGTGKTLLAKAVAKESGANMLEVSAASINDMWLGQSEKNVRALFSLARKMSPMVIFLDEADALLGARHQGPGRSGHRETITQFLREWDGLSDMRAFIMVATNRPFDLDEAVLRRLPRKILVDLPLVPERESILRVMLREETLADDVDLVQLAKETDLYSGSDLKNLCVSAAMEAVREEVRHKEAWEGEGEYVFPERRVLNRKHFEKGMKDISASISEDMDSLKAIRKFDEQYGDSGRRRKGKKKGMGFEVVTGPGGTEEVRVRQVVTAAVTEGKRE
ncbi:hypothetical protein QBC35DRAFT_490546 [Podospora australis]|uniref:AAA+ ATPase domain-containing protein n=1 Tax=Podospora australis TaxID=1536484 RepID=A0AAN6WZS6_9PEZI|nr:hypothetical protein QBC35DRAFT_490546 [Podospora australis]